MAHKTIKPRPFTRSDDLPAPRDPVAHITLDFSGDAEDDEHPIHDISACAWSRGALFVAGDEAHSIERLVPGRHGWFTQHTTYPLGDFLDLKDPDEEVDIEGLAVDGKWLWVTGSHSRTRHDPRDDGEEPDCIDLSKLADLKDTRARCVLARIPLAEDEDGWPAPVKRCGKRRAGMVAQKKDHGSKLGRYLAKDKLIGPSMALAAKEGGLDIEGIAAKGKRVALGLRGPTIQTYALLVEPQFKFKKKGKLHLPGKPYIRLLDLDGLGVRDLVVDGNDLYILAGPTQDLDGRCAIYVWEGWATDQPEDETTVKLHHPERLFDLPVKFHADHPEGIDFTTDEDGNRRLAVFYDSPNPDRLDIEKATILGDLFEIDR